MEREKIKIKVRKCKKNNVNEIWNLKFELREEREEWES